MIDEAELQRLKETSSAEPAWQRSPLRARREAYITVDDVASEEGRT